MAEFKLGRIRFVWQGNWSTGNNYVVDDVISRGGKSFICVLNHESDEWATDSIAIPRKWDLVADGQEWKNDWTPSTYYNLGDIVKYGGMIYICKQIHTSATYASPNFLGLEQNLASWDLFAESFDWKGAWATAVRYKVNDFVTYGGTTYVCNTPHISNASASVGLEADLVKWDVFNQGIVYRNEWVADATRYRINDIVKYGADLWICTAHHTSDNSPFPTDKFSVFLNGFEFENSWNNTEVYQIGDTVTYGGYSYIAKRNNTGATPTSSPLDWDVFTTGFNFRNDWDSATDYKVGDVVRLGGYTYLATADSTNQVPPTGAYWAKLNSGLKWAPSNGTYTGVSGTNLSGTGTSATFDITRQNTTYVVTVNNVGSGYATTNQIKILGSLVGGITPVNDITITVTGVSSGTITAVTVAGISTTWETGTAYVLGDVVFFGANSYICIDAHIGATPNRPDNDITATYWNLLTAGAESASLTTKGDIFYYGDTGPTRLPLGQDGQLLRVSGAYPKWAYYGVINNLVYVAPTGVDSLEGGYGLTLDKPWKTVRYACKQIEDGYLYKNSTALLAKNKQFLMKEVSNWVTYTYTVNITASSAATNEFTAGSTSSLTANMPIQFSGTVGGVTAGTKYFVKQVIDGTHFTISNTQGGIVRALGTQTAAMTGSLAYDYNKCQRDVGYIVDALVYDIGHGGTDDSVKVARSYYTVLGNAYITSNFGQQATQTVAAYNYLKVLVASVLNNATPASNYQTLNGVSVGNQAIQNIDLTLTAEADIDDVAVSLVDIVVKGIQAGSATAIPVGVQANTTISIKTGTFFEILPIVVPKNVALVGDELRGSVIQPAPAIASLANDKTKTISALTRIKNITSDVMQNIAITPTTGNTATQVTTLPAGDVGSQTAIDRTMVNVDVMYDILANGLGGAPVESIPDPTGYDSNFANARTQIAQNYAFIKADVSQYISNNFNSVWVQLGATGQAKCQRDVEYILDAIRYDITYGGNTQTLITGSAYFSYTLLTIPSYSKAATIAAYTHMKSIIDDVAQKLAVTPQAGNSTPQVVTGTGGNASAATFAQDRMQNVIDWITNGTSPAVIAPSTAWVASDIVAANTALQAAKAEIQSDAVGWVKKFNQTLTFNESTCSRDVGLIVDALGYDMLFGSNFASTIAGKSYYRGISSAQTVISSQKSATLGLLKFLKYKVKSVVASGSVVKVKTTIDDITTYITGGAVPRLTWPNPYTITTNSANAKNLIWANKEFVQAELIQYLTTNYPGNNYSQASCRQDIGYIIDALRYDLTYGGNFASNQAGAAYYSYTELQIDANDKVATLAAYGVLKTIVQAIAQGGVYTALQLGVTRVTGPTGTGTEASTVGALVDIITGIIDTGVIPSPLLASTGWVDATLVAQNTGLQTARATIQAAVISYINTNYPTLVYNTGTCSRDIGLIIDAVGYDMLFDANYRSVKAGMAYHRAVASALVVLTSQKSATIGALRFLKTQITTVVANNATARSRARAAMDVVINILDKGIGETPEYVGTITYNNTLATINGAEILRANKPFLENEATAWISANFGGTVVSTQGNPTNTFTTSSAHNLVAGDPVVFTATTVNTIAVATTGSNDRVTIGNTVGVVANMPIVFTGTGFGNLMSGVTYYVKTIETSTQITISETTGGATFDLIDGTGTLTTVIGGVIGGVTAGQTYKILTVPSTTTFTVENPTLAGSTLAVSAGFGVATATYGFEPALCRRDMREYINALIFDLEYTGNYKSLFAANLYNNAVGGSIKSDMFYVRNSTGVRNMTVSGLTGELTEANDFGTKRPTAGAYVSLDPGFGPNDSRAWVTSRSCYVQNVTTFGTACVGCKIDGALHAGGNRSIVSNDFTQVLSDGIGVWCTGNNALTELVSVFSYYGYAGYMAELGGRIRATNGNSSYGTYGVVAEGVDSYEVPIYGTIDNKAFQALVTNVVTDGVDGVLRFEFGNAGENYTNHSPTINGAGYNATAIGDEFRDTAVFETRIIDLNDGNGVGGTNYAGAANAAQGGSKTTITLAATDTALSGAYVGMRVQITGGTGVGQYANVLIFSNGSKEATVWKDSFTPLTLTASSGSDITTSTTVNLYVNQPVIFSAAIGTLAANTVYYVQSVTNGTQFRVASATGGAALSVGTTTGQSITLYESGWDHIVAGTPIVNALDLTTAYIVEPRISYTAPGFTGTARSMSATAQWSAATYGSEKFVAVATGGTATSYSNDGITWANAGALPSSSTWNDVVFGGGQDAVATAVVGGLGGQGAVLEAILGVANTTGAATADQVATVRVINGGVGYTTPPTILFGGPGTGATATCTVLNGAIATVTVSIPGSGYSVAPAVTAATDRVTRIVVSSWGRGYTSAPTVTLSGGGSSNQATATATLTNTGVSSIAVGNDGGSGYTSTPTVSIVDSNAKYIAIAGTNNAYQTPAGLGTAWTAGNAFSTAMASLTYGSGVFVAVGGTNGCVSSVNGQNWTARTIPTLGAGTYTAVTYGNNKFLAISSNNGTAHSSNGSSWTAGGNLPGALSTWTSVAYGNGRFVAIASNSRSVAYSYDTGVTWNSSPAGLPSAVNWTHVSYGQGLFFAIASGTPICATSSDGVTWTQRAMPSSTNWSALAFGNPVNATLGNSPIWIAASSSSGTVGASFKTGARPLGRVRTASGVVTEIRMIEPGSGFAKGTVSATTTSTNLITVNDTTNLVDSQPIEFFGTTAGGLVIERTYYVIGSTITSTQFKVSATPGSATPVTLNTATASNLIYRASSTATITDPNKIKVVAVRVRQGDGALGNPSFTNRGLANTTASADIIGDGRANLYQPSTFVNLSGLYALPQPGANVEFASIPGIWFKLVTVTNVLGEAGNYSAQLQINPAITVYQAPNHGDIVTTRLKYSQVRLTGHDYLYIGTGNFASTNYPGIPYNQPVTANQQLASGGGRVFFTSTDQDGNFNVGGLFGVQQATGTATLNASAFNLSGLNSLQLGAVELGVGSAIITQFSTDPYFTANSDNVVPTQRAIRSYITAQIGGGQSSLNVNTLTSGVVYIAGNTISTTTGVQININAKMNFTGGIDGAPVALGFFMQR